MYGDIEQSQKEFATAEEPTVQRLAQIKSEPKNEDVRVNEKPSPEKRIGLGKQTLYATEDQRQSVFDDYRGQEIGQPVLVRNWLYDAQSLDSNIFSDNMTMSPQYVTFAIMQPSEVEFRELYFTNGDHYRGYCLRGQSIPHGQGVKTSPGKFVHEGNYKNGLFHGFGKITFQLEYRPTGSPLISYEGGFQDGHYHGEGMAIYWVPATAAMSTQDCFVCYSGGWSWGEKNGHGRMRYGSGAQYDGGWKDGVRHGQGTFSWANGYYYYDGGWKDGKKSGYGLLISGDGCRYEGGWLDDNQYGHGIKTEPVAYEVIQSHN